MLSIRIFCFVFALGFCFANADPILSLTRVAGGFSKPVQVTFAPGDANHIYVTEKTGTVRKVNTLTNSVSPTPFFTFPAGEIGSLHEQGLLGITFHPNYATNDLFYAVTVPTPTSATPNAHNMHIREYSGSTGSQVKNILSIDQPETNHNGGWLAFGPNDGFLYVATGDGGGANDNSASHTFGIGNAQDLSKLHGKILRIDVNSDDFSADPNRNYAIPSSNPFANQAGEDEIWAYGLRNPWRNSFDRNTGDLLIADVGQDAREEINFQPANSVGGENYGWRLREGTAATPTPSSDPVGGPKPAGAIDPVYDYDHTLGQSVTGGYVYRGPITALQGTYFFGDFITSSVWSINIDGTSPATFDGTNFSDLSTWQIATDSGTLDSISSFGEDLAGNLYLVDYDGEIYKVNGVSNLIATPVPEPSALLLGVVVAVLWRSSFLVRTWGSVIFKFRWM